MMRKFLLIVLTTAFSAVFNSLNSQEIRKPEKVNVDGTFYYMHPVVSGETLYSISKRYNIDATLIVRENPQLVSGLKSGDTLKIPVPAATLETASGHPEKKQSMISHEVQRRETLYSISRQYGVTIDDILHANPGMGTLRRGDRIQIPRQAGHAAEAKLPVPAKQPEKSEAKHMVKPGDTFFSIAREYNTTPQLVQAVNPGVTVLKPGMTILIPDTSFLASPEIQVSAPVREEFLEHVIVSGETLFSLTRKYNVTAERLVALNPSLDGSFRAGTVIRVPVAAVSRHNDDFVKHIAGDGETIYRIARLYQVSVEEVKGWNKYLDYRNLIQGDTVRVIPGKFAHGFDSLMHQPAIVHSSECDKLRASPQSRKTLQVVMLLPLMAEANNSLNSDNLLSGFSGNEEFSMSPDSVRIMRNERNPVIRFQGNSENFIHFYEGALLAVDSLMQAGIKVNLQVYDTENREARVRQLVATGKLNQADLIIGPVYPEEQKEVAEFAMRNQIPMVSPLSATSDLTKSNPWVFQVNTPRNIVNQKTAEYVVSRYSRSNFIILKTGRQATEPENELVEQIRSKITGNGGSRVRTCDFQKAGLAGLREMVEKDQKNVILLTSGNEADISVAFSNLHTLAGGHDITVIGNNRISQYESISTEYFHDGQLEFLAPYWPDYNTPIARSFIRKFRSHFKTEPNQFSMQGYDVTYFFVRAASDFGRDFRDCVQSVRPGLLQGNYFFEKLPSGGYVNKGLSVITFTRDYRVTSSALRSVGE